MVGPWCFADAYGPSDIRGQAGMQVPPHPHMGLQTVSWLVTGEVLHRDSLGSTQLVRPGALNLMTAGAAISHSEESPSQHSDTLHGAQLWVALPEASRHIPAGFESHGRLPTVSAAGGDITVMMGAMDGVTAPATTYFPMVGAELSLKGPEPLTVPLEPAFEHAVLALTDGVRVADTPLSSGSMLYVGSNRRDLRVDGDNGARGLLLGGVPFEERLVMWWNFVARTHDEIDRARHDWELGRTSADAGARFGQVAGYDGDPLPAPRLPNTRLRARGRARDT